MMHTRNLSGIMVRLLAPVILSLLLTAGAASSAAWSDDRDDDDGTEYGEGTVLVHVTIDPLDLCERALPGCEQHGDVLGMTGIPAATPLGLGVLLLALGSGTWVLARRRGVAAAE